MQENIINLVSSLPLHEKTALRDFLTIDIAKSEDRFELSDAQKKELDEAYEEYLADPSTATDREEAEKEIFKRS